MNVFSKDDLQLLLDCKTSGICSLVSIFMPTFRAGPDTQQGPSRLRNLIHAAGLKLEETGMRASDAAKLLAPAVNLLNDAFFWRNQNDGLAIFSGPDFFHYYRVPVNLRELVIVNERFHIKPLYSLLSDDSKFYILSVSQKGIGMFLCTRFGYREVNLPVAVPANFAEAMKYENLDREMQYHGHVGDTDYHGHIGIESVGNILTSHGRTITQEHKDRLLRYFQQVDRGLNEIMREEKAPLVFSGVDYLFPIYQQANSYANLHDKVIMGNPDKVSIQDLHAKAWEILKPRLNESKLQSLARYNKMKGTGLTSSDVKEIAVGAQQGKIDTLFIDENREQWGSFDPDTNSVVLHEKQESCDEDLLDFALSSSIIRKGTAYVLKEEEMPAPLAAAIFRY